MHKEKCGTWHLGPRVDIYKHNVEGKFLWSDNILPFVTRGRKRIFMHPVYMQAQLSLIIDYRNIFISIIKIYSLSVPDRKKINRFSVMLLTIFSSANWKCKLNIISRHAMIVWHIKIKFSFKRWPCSCPN